MMGTCSERETGLDVLSVAELGGGLGGEVERDVHDGERVGRVVDVRTVLLVRPVREEVSRAFGDEDRVGTPE